MAVTFSGIAGSDVTISGGITTVIDPLVVKQFYKSHSSTTKATLITPASGKKVRIHSITATGNSATATLCGIYFGTGATFLTVPGTCFWLQTLDLGVTDSVNMVFARGSEPVGAADEIVSVNHNGANTVYYTITWSEE